jgi:transposase
MDGLPLHRRDRDQLFLLPVSMRDWLAEGHLAWFVIEVVERIDTCGLHVRHRNDGVGRPAYDPDMMLALLFYAYATGMRSSRRIEASCRTDAAYRVICVTWCPTTPPRLCSWSTTRRRSARSL